MDSQLNKLSPLKDFDNALIPGQMPNEDTFRSAPFKDLVGWMQVQLDLKGAELLDPVSPGTQAAPAVIPPGPAGNKRKFEPQPGFYQGFPEVTSNKRWYFYWNGSSWSLKDMGALPKGSDGKTVETFDPAKSGGYNAGSQVIFEEVIYEVLAGQTATTGQSPSTNPEKFKAIFSGGGNVLKELTQSYNLITQVNEEEIELGSIGTNGVPYDQADYARTKNFITKFKKGEKLIFEVPYGFISVRLLEYGDTGTALVKSYTTLQYGANEITLAGSRVKIVFQKTGITTLDITGNPSFKIIQKNVSLADRIADVNVRLSVNEYFISGIDKTELLLVEDFAKGAINGTTGVISTTGNSIVNKVQRFIGKGGQLTINRPLQANVPHHLVIFKYDYDKTYLGNTGNLPINEVDGVSFNVFKDVDFAYYYVQITRNPVTEINPNMLNESTGFTVITKLPKLENRLKSEFEWQAIESKNNTVIQYNLNGANTNLSGALGGNRAIMTLINVSGYRYFKITMPTGVKASYTVWKNGVVLTNLNFANPIPLVDVRNGDSLYIVFAPDTGNFTQAMLDSLISGTTIELTKDLNGDILSGAKKATLNKAFPLKIGIDSVAHRGLAIGNIAPENSLGSFYYAALAGFEWCEMDVQKTADGQYVIMHDPTINRTMVNLDGSTISETITISDVTLSHLRTTYVFKTRYEDQKKPIPTLDEVITLCKIYNLKPLLEMKGEFANSDMDAIYDKCVKVLGRKGFGFTAFSNPIMEYSRSMWPDLVIHWLGKSSSTDFADPINPNDYVSVGAGWQPTGTDTLLPDFNRKGIKVGTWQLGAMNEIQLAKRGYSFVTTGYPPSTEKMNALFCLDIKDANSVPLFKVNGQDVVFGYEPVKLKATDVLTINDYINNNVLFLGCVEYIVEFSGDIRLDGSNTTISGASQDAIGYVERKFIQNAVCPFKLLAMTDCTIRNLVIKVTKY